MKYFIYILIPLAAIILTSCNNNTTFHGFPSYGSFKKSKIVLNNNNEGTIFFKRNQNDSSSVIKFNYKIEPETGKIDLTFNENKSGKNNIDNTYINEFKKGEFYIDVNKKIISFIPYPSYPDFDIFYTDDALNNQIRIDSLEGIFFTGEGYIMFHKGYWAFFEMGSVDGYGGIIVKNNNIELQNNQGHQPSQCRLISDNVLYFPDEKVFYIRYGKLGVEVPGFNYTKLKQHLKNVAERDKDFKIKGFF